MPRVEIVKLSFKNFRSRTFCQRTQTTTLQPMMTLIRFSFHHHEEFHCEPPPPGSCRIVSTGHRNVNAQEKGEDTHDSAQPPLLRTDTLLRITSWQHPWLGKEGSGLRDVTSASHRGRRKCEFRFPLSKNRNHGLLRA
eukprot:16991-Rhodomonas_salina.1